jgi:cell division protein FtsB
MSNFSVKPGSWRQTSSRFQTGIKDYTLADRVTAKELVVTDTSDLVSAVQSLSAEVNALKQDVADLKANASNPSS